MKLSHEQIKRLIQHAIDSAYPPYVAPGEELYGYECRYRISLTWENRVFVNKTWHSEETDPRYATISFTLDEEKLDEAGHPTVVLGDFVAMKLVARPVDGSSDMDVELESTLTVDELFTEGKWKKKHAKPTKMALNSVIRSLVGLMKSEDLEPETVDAINTLVIQPKSKESQESTEADQTEVWDGISGETFTETIEHSVEGEFDKKAMIIKGNKMLGVESRNGRRYPIETQKASVAVFEGAKAFLNHPLTRDMGEARDVRDLIGVHKNVRVEASGTYSDLHLIDNPTVRDFVLPVAESAPNLIGSSVVIRAKMKKGKDGIPEAESILACRSVDLVSEPATTNGLYESSVPVTTGDAEKMTATQETTMEMKDLTLEMLRKDRPDIYEAIVAAIAKDQEADKLKTQVEALSLQLKESDARVVQLEASLAAKTQEDEIETMVREAKVSNDLKYDEQDGKKVIKAHISRVLKACKDTAERQEFIASWEGMVKSPSTKAETPVSTEQKVPVGVQPLSQESMAKYAMNF